MRLITIFKSDARTFTFKYYDKTSKLTFKYGLLAWLSPEFRLVWSYRCYRFLYVNGYRKIAHLLYLRSKYKYGSDINPACSIGIPFKVGHHMNIVVGPNAILGSDIYLMNGVSIGNKHVGLADSMPIIGDGVIIGTGSKILGGIEIGAGAKIGANSVVVHNVPCNEVWVGAPAKKVGGGN